MLPTFLGIGVAKAGTTWLHRLLRSHPDVWMPMRRKEIYFFTAYYGRGLEWYERFFPDESEAGHYRAVGEFTPDYFCRSVEAPERIAQVPSIRKFILSLRNPVDRLYSAYGHRVRNYNYQKPFEAFLEEYPNEIEHGFYGRHFERYLQYFEREQFLVLFFEELFDDIAATKETLADFLEVDPARFPEEAGERQVNPTYVPRFRGAFAFAQKGLRILREWEMGWVMELLHRSGIGPLGKRLLGQQKEHPAEQPMPPEMRTQLYERYAGDIEALESLLGRDLSIWKEEH